MLVRMYNAFNQDFTVIKIRMYSLLEKQLIHFNTMQKVDHCSRQSVLICPRKFSNDGYTHHRMLDTV